VHAYSHASQFELFVLNVVTVAAILDPIVDVEVDHEGIAGRRAERYVLGDGAAPRAVALDAVPGLAAVGALVGGDAFGAYIGTVVLRSKGQVVVPEERSDGVLGAESPFSLVPGADAFLGFQSSPIFLRKVLSCLVKRLYLLPYIFRYFFRLRSDAILFQKSGHFLRAR
jgi:hypothetical protein